MKTINKKIRVSHYPNIPCKPFTIEVKNEFEAYLISEVLANQHLFLFENKFIPDYANIISVEMWDEEMDADGEGCKWCDYYNEEEEMEWEDFKNKYLEDEKN